MIMLSKVNSTVNITSFLICKVRLAIAYYFVVLQLFNFMLRIGMYLH